MCSDKNADMSDTQSVYNMCSGLRLGLFVEIIFPLIPGYMCLNTKLIFLSVGR